MQRRTAVILAADVAGYTRLVAAAEEQALMRYADHRSVLDAAVAHHGGRIFNTAGDAVRAEFKTPLDAVTAAADLQRALRARNASYPLAKQLHFRVGIADGEVAEQDGDLHGAAVTLALALETAAPPGGICVSGPVHAATKGALPETFASMGSLRLPTLADPVSAFAVIIDPAAAAAPQLAAAPRAASGILRTIAIGGVALAGIVVLARGLPSPDPVVPPAVEQPARPAASPTATPAPAVTPPAPPSPQSAPAAPTPSAQPAIQPAIQPAADPQPPKPAQQADNVPVPAAPADVAAVLARLQRLWGDCLSNETKRMLDGCGQLASDTTLTKPDRVRANIAYGKTLRDALRPAEAIAAYTTAIGLAPTSDLYNLRGIASFDKNDWDRAIADYTDAIRLDARNGEAYNNRAWTKFKAGRPRDAVGDAKTATDLLGQASYVWDTRGHVQEAAGNTDDALTSFKRAIAIDPGNETSRAGIQRLGGAR